MNTKGTLCILTLSFEKRMQASIQRLLKSWPTEQWDLDASVSEKKESKLIKKKDSVIKFFFKIRNNTENNISIVILHGNKISLQFK